MNVAVRGIILFGHGSRDPLWRGPIEAVASRLAHREPAAQVRCAYLELMEPDLPAAAADLAGHGVTHITVVPMFLGTGRHAREDLPALVAGARLRHPDVEFRLQPAVGEDPRVVDLLAQVALE